MSRTVFALYLLHVVRTHFTSLKREVNQWMACCETCITKSLYSMLLQQEEEERSKRRSPAAAWE